MDGLFDSLNDLFHTDWINGFQEHYDFDLSDDMIADSVHQASAFYNMCDPASVVEWDTTAVALNDPWTPDDDVLLFNREQMSNLGITDKEGFDLVLTHEIGHRELQAMRNVTGFNSYQEELCCDYMVGVRAGLNDMDVSKITDALSDMEAGETHPDGALRVQAVEDGVRFAHQYMDTHYDNPTFDECLEHFEKTSTCVITADDCKPDQHGYVENSEAAPIAHSDEKEFNPSFKGGDKPDIHKINNLKDDISYHQRKVRSAENDIHYYSHQLKRTNLAEVTRNDYEHILNSAIETLKSESAKIKSLQAELNKLM